MGASRFGTAHAEPALSTSLSAGLGLDVNSKARQQLTDTFVLGTQDLGRGQVVYLADNPLFRAFWQSGKLLFSNAVFLVGQ